MSHWVKEKGFSHKGAIAQQQFGLGEYHHVLGTVDAREGIVTIYIDGDKERSRYWNVGPEAEQRSGVSWEMGKVHPNNFFAPLSGTVDEVRLYNRALSAQEMEELYLFTWRFLQRSEVRAFHFRESVLKALPLVNFGVQGIVLVGGQAGLGQGIFGGGRKENQLHHRMSIAADHDLLALLGLFQQAREVFAGVLPLDLGHGTSFG